MAGLDPQTIRHALAVSQRQGFAEIELESDGESFKAVIDAASRPLKAPPMNGIVSLPDSAGGGAGERIIPAPFVGYFRALETPLQAGRHVEKGEIVATIAALGLANDVESPFSGEVLEILVEPGQPVEFGQPIARIREA